MTEAARPNDSSPPTKNTVADKQENPQNYPYASLLDQLESKAYQDLSRPADDEATDNQSTRWNLSHDALLATLLHEFTNHVVQRTHEVSVEVQKLQSSVNNVGVDVTCVQNEWMKCSRTVAMEHVVKEEEVGSSNSSESTENSEESNKKKEGDDDDSAAEIARLEEEEKSAIQDGMKALSLFYDRRKARQSSADITEDGLGFDEDELFDGDEDIIGDNCYYYPSAEGDVFNQRPLPFIIGSPEFMESSSAGLGATDELDEVAS